MDSTVSFYGDIGFDADHRNVRDFASEEARTAWFAGKTHTTLQCNYDKVNRSLKVEMQYGEALAFSYCIVSMDGQRDMYCFIDSCEVINDRTVSFQLTVDPWQTYLFSFTLGRSFVVRSHMDRWTASSAKPSMQIYPNEAVDGFQESSRPGYLSKLDEKGQPFVWMVMARTVTPEADRSYIEYDCSPVSVGHPYANVVWDNSEDEDMPDLVELMDGTAFTKMGIDPNTIVFIGLLPVLPIEVRCGYANALSAFIVYDDFSGPAEKVKIGSYTLLKLNPSEGGSPQLQASIPKVEVEVAVDTPTKPSSPYVNDSGAYEPTMFMSPMRTVMAYTGSGEAVWQASDDLLLGGSFTLNATAIPSGSGYTTRYWVKSVSANSFAKEDAVNRAFDVSAMAIDTASNNWLTYLNTERDTSRKMVKLNAMRSIVNGATSALQSAQTPLGMLNSLTATATTTLTEAVFAYKEIAINEQGIKNQSNGLLSSGSGTGMAFTFSVVPEIIQTMADSETYDLFYRKVRRNGYAVGRYMDIDIRSRYWFNYVQTAGANVRGNFSESVRRELKAIFDAGVTIWHDDAEMDTDKCNIERSLIA